MMGEKCVTLEVEGARQRGRPRKTWKEIVDDLHWILVNGGNDYSELE